MNYNSYYVSAFAHMGEISDFDAIESEVNTLMTTPVGSDKMMRSFVKGDKIVPIMAPVGHITCREYLVRTVSAMDDRLSVMNGVGYNTYIKVTCSGYDDGVFSTFYSGLSETGKKHIELLSRVLYGNQVLIKAYANGFAFMVKSQSDSSALHVAMLSIFYRVLPYIPELMNEEILDRVVKAGHPNVWISEILLKNVNVMEKTNWGGNTAHSPLGIASLSLYIRLGASGARQSNSRRLSGLHNGIVNYIMHYLAKVINIQGFMQPEKFEEYAKYIPILKKGV